MKPRKCCGCAPWFEVEWCASGNYWASIAYCETCDCSASATGPTPQSALDAAIAKWNVQKGGEK